MCEYRRVTPHGSNKIGASASPAQWLRDRLSAPDAGVVTSLIPGGFESYARILHPVQERGGTLAPLRWRDVAAWSGVGLHATISWLEVALPEVIPVTEAPWDSQGPREGSLSRADTIAVVEDLRRFTNGSCYFAVWAGYGGGVWVHPPNAPDVTAPTALSQSPEFELPYRDYLLYEGVLDGATCFAGVGEWFQSPNLWGPEDHSWCVASEIDLPWTYVAGPKDLIDTLLGDGRIEALATAPDDSTGMELAHWLVQRVVTASDEVVRNGAATLELAAGTVIVDLQRINRTRSTLTWRAVRRGGSASSTTPIDHRHRDSMLDEVRNAISHAVLALIQV